MRYTFNGREFDTDSTTPTFGVKDLLVTGLAQSSKSRAELVPLVRSAEPPSLRSYALNRRAGSRQCSSPKLAAR